MADVTQEQAPRRARRIPWRYLAILAVLLGYAVLKLCQRPPPGSEIPARMTFEGDSAQLRRTVFVPTLDTPMPEGRNVVWCLSFQLAWNALRDDVVKEPVLVANAEVVADRLNRAPQSEADVPPDSCYAAAGPVQGGIVETIQREMAERFPSVVVPPLAEPGDVIVAYAYLTARVKFTLPYFENRDEFVFTDSAGQQTPVASFGVRQKDCLAYLELRRQARVLYCPVRVGPHIAGDAEFALDLCSDSRPNQIVVARLKPKATLAQTLADLQQKIARSPLRDDPPDLGGHDTLLVPSMCWEINHHFRELEGEDKLLLNRGFEGLYIAKALQMMRFRLDRSGAELASQAKLDIKPAPADFLFDRPFLVCIRKRGAQDPFFVLWVDNAELLCPVP